MLGRVDVVNAQAGEQVISQIQDFPKNPPGNVGLLRFGTVEGS